MTSGNSQNLPETTGSLLYSPLVPCTEIVKESMTINCWFPYPGTDGTTVLQTPPFTTEAPSTNMD